MTRQSHRLFRPGICVAVAMTLGAGGCLDWQAAYDAAAQQDCREIVNAEERQDCLTALARGRQDRFP